MKSNETKDQTKKPGTFSASESIIAASRSASSSLK